MQPPALGFDLLGLRVQVRDLRNKKVQPRLISARGALGIGAELAAVQRVTSRTLAHSDCLGRQWQAALQPELADVGGNALGNGFALGNRGPTSYMRHAAPFAT